MSTESVTNFGIVEASSKMRALLTEGRANRPASDFAPLHSPSPSDSCAARAPSASIASPAAARTVELSYHQLLQLLLGADSAVGTVRLTPTATGKLAQADFIRQAFGAPVAIDLAARADEVSDPTSLELDLLSQIELRIAKRQVDSGFVDISLDEPARPTTLSAQ